MADFTLDTSGAVPVHPDDGADSDLAVWWSDLDAFTQGYIEALLQDAPAVGALSGDLRFPGFSDLAPETLARIIADCARREAQHKPDITRTIVGKLFWNHRQHGVLGADFPPLTAYLGDHGRVYLREAA